MDEDVLFENNDWLHNVSNWRWFKLPFLSYSMAHKLFISCLRGYDEFKMGSLQLPVVLIDSRPWHFENSRLIGNFPGRKYFPLGVKYQIILERYHESIHKSFIILISSCFLNSSFDKLEKNEIFHNFWCWGKFPLLKNGVNLLQIWFSPIERPHSVYVPVNESQKVVDHILTKLYN